MSLRGVCGCGHNNGFAGTQPSEDVKETENAYAMELLKRTFSMKPMATFTAGSDL